MKHAYPLLAVLALASITAQAQQFRPFRTGTAHQFTETSAADTIHTLRLESAALVGSDSVFRFNGRVVPVRRVLGTTCYLTHVQRPDNLFGATLTKRAAGTEYVLTAANGRTFTLRPRAALGQPWAATSTGLTAHVTARAIDNVLGLPDSVVTIALSDGKTLRLSKHYGLVSGPALGAYLNGRHAARQLTLSALPGLRLGAEKTGAPAVYDFQPSDVFLRYSKQEGSLSNLCSESWVRDSVLTRALSRTGDTITYRIWSRKLTRTYGSPGAPAGFCQGSAGTVLEPARTTELQVTRSQQAGAPATLTNTTVGNIVPNGFVAVGFGARRTPNYYGRATQSLVDRQVCGVQTGDSVRLADIIDNGREQRYTAGLGLVFLSNWGIYSTLTTTLLGYRKVNLPTSTGTEVWGVLTTFPQILKAADYRPAASTAAFPNPFTSDLTVRFDAQRSQQTQVQLYNSLGQLVHETSRPVAAGVQQFILAVPTVPAGLYSLHLQHDGRTEVLKVLRAQ
ncbi:T9SS type A sorting domain-containing protein [Hymenobacter busanensis]|uniref:T9SS type A sorting domain-containing protein n=1 Tax=Hymenobacter busanensis TaxID=2607656 RepID=A0A7L4ZZB0_9BACT|nr:T9SS type A sorting domain-containing protein [Hymenobacter busanensis]KAA9333138.1 T9SS type A sorting domain-containing protein [Hymenobacter busanensis]QHJ08186.1 T9SS type A sorting domain-containing protein [Hymenobacter busanensis]